MLARDWDMRVSPLQGLGDLWGRLTWACARRTRSSPGYHIAGLQHFRIGGLKARDAKVRGEGARTPDHRIVLALKGRDCRVRVVVPDGCLEFRHNKFPAGIRFCGHVYPGINPLPAPVPTAFPK